MDSKGFSILELMVTMAVLMIGIGVASASSSSVVNSSKGVAEAQKVKDVLLKARNMARFDLRCVVVNVQPQQIQITPYSDCTLNDALPGETILFDQTISLSQFDTGNPLVFNPQGGTTSASPATMTVTTTSGMSYRYTVMPAIGTISSR